MDSGSNSNPRGRFLGGLAARSAEGDIHADLPGLAPQGGRQRERLDVGADHHGAGAVGAERADDEALGCIAVGVDGVRGEEGGELAGDALADAVVDVGFGFGLGGDGGVGVGHGLVRAAGVRVVEFPVRHALILSPGSEDARAWMQVLRCK